MNKHDTTSKRTAVTRPFARTAARELTAVELKAIAGGRPNHTMATGANGDDPGDPGI